MAWAIPKCAEAGMQVFRSGGVSPNKSREMVRLRWLTTPIYSEEWKTGLFMEAETERCAMGKRRRKAPCHPLETRTETPILPKSSFS